MVHIYIGICICMSTNVCGRVDSPNPPPTKPKPQKTGRRAFRRQPSHVQARVHSVLKRYMRQCLWGAGAAAAGPSSHPHPHASASALVKGRRAQQQGQQPLPSHVPLLALYASFLPAADRRAVLSEYFEGACVCGRGLCVWGGLGWWWRGGGEQQATYKAPSSPSITPLLFNEEPSTGVHPSSPRTNHAHAHHPHLFISINNRTPKKNTRSPCIHSINHSSLIQACTPPPSSAPLTAGPPHQK